MWSTCSAPWPIRATKSALSACCGARSSRSWTRRSSGSSRRPDGVPGGLFADHPPAELDAEQAARRTRFAADNARFACAHEGPRADRALLQECPGAHRLRRRALGRIPRPAEAGQLEQARRAGAGFDQSGVFGLDDFITRLSEFIARQPDEPLAATHPEHVDVVRLMSIHQAKGLEFPVVVVPDVDRRSLGMTGKVAFTPRLGPMVNQGRDGPSGGYELFRSSEREQQDAELVRLLYVAATRAADYSDSFLRPGGRGQGERPLDAVALEAFRSVDGGASCGRRRRLAIGHGRHWRFASGRRRARASDG